MPGGRRPSWFGPHASYAERSNGADNDSYRYNYEAVEQGLTEGYRVSGFGVDSVGGGSAPLGSSSAGILRDNGHGLVVLQHRDSGVNLRGEVTSEGAQVVELPPPYIPSPGPSRVRRQAEIKLVLANGSDSDVKRATG